MKPTDLDPAPALDGVAIGRARKEARRRRTRLIRRRVAAWATGLFAAAWLGIAVQLVSGHDPALARTSSHATASAASTATSAAATAAPSAPSSGSTSSSAPVRSSSIDNSPSGNVSSSGSGTSAVTTRQS